MRLIKTFGLAAVAAVASMAFLGASSAMAENTALCSTTENPCTNHALSNVHVEARATDVTFVASSITVLCSELNGIPASTILGELLSLAAPLIGHLSLVDYNDCKRVTESCTVTTLKAGLIQVLRNGGDSATIKSTGSEILLACGSFLPDCVYGGTPTLTVTGGAPGTMHATEAKLEIVSGFLCPTTLFWTATYSIALPNPVHIEN